jgi:hypothetical protein
MSHDIILNFDCEAFLAYFRKRFTSIACILCMHIHPVRIHQFHERLIRSEVTETNIKIMIFSIYCPYAHAEGRQYTKRILPYFVIPECNICLVNVIRFYKHSRFSGKPNYDLAAGILGTVDERTIKRHFFMLRSYLEIATAELVGFLVSIPNLVTLPDVKSHIYSDMDLFMKYITLLNTALEKAGENVECKPVRILHRVYTRQKYRLLCPYLPMNLVLCSFFFNDTS